MATSCHADSSGFSEGLMRHPLLPFGSSPRAAKIIHFYFLL